MTQSGHGLNSGHLTSHRAHSLRPIGARVYAPAGVRGEKSKKLCDLCGLCERKGKCVLLSKILMAEIRTNPLNPLMVGPVLRD